MDEKKPVCIGIILDGNRRWAKERGLPKLEGHRQGLEKIMEAIKWVRDSGIQHVAAFMFSTENWNREPGEVSYLMGLFKEMAQARLDELKEENVRVRFVGQRERFDEELQKLMKKVEEETASNTGVTLWACLSYGGRAEIVAAAKAAAEAGEEITEESIRKFFWSAEMPDLDILIRTSGEKRISNFMLWQAAYAEFFFIEPHWPDFSKEIFDSIIKEYGERERRMGK